MPPEAPRARRLLAERLATVRSLSHVSVRDLAAAIGISYGQVSKIQGGQRLPDVALTMAWLDACHVADPEVRREVVELLEQAHASTLEWRREARSGSVQHIERERIEPARLICSYQPAIVPGLLQTEAYARVIVSAIRAPNIEVEATVAGRMRNQAALGADGRRFEFVIGEHAMARDFGDPGLRDQQVDRIASISERDNVTIYVLPDTVVSPGVPFTIYDEPTGAATPIVAIEAPTRGFPLDDPREVQTYRDWFARLRRASRPLA